MKKHTLLGTVMAAMLLIPAMASAEDQPAANDGREMMHNEMMHKMPHHGFEEADTDKDGALSLDEFLERHKKKFSEIDADKSGSLSQDELKTYGEAHREKMKERREEFKEKHQSPGQDVPDKQSEETKAPQ